MFQGRSITWNWCEMTGEQIAIRHLACRSATIAAVTAIALLVPIAAPRAQEVPMIDPWTAGGAASQSLEAGRTAETGAGEVGQRQSARDVSTGIEPTQRVNSRINSRVQSRIRSRIDRNYNPEADATSSIEAAAARTRRAMRP